MLRLAFSLVGFATVAYAVFGVQIGEQTLAGHAGEVWRSDLAQEKIRLIRHEVLEKGVTQILREQSPAMREASSDERSRVDPAERTKSVRKAPTRRNGRDQTHHPVPDKERKDLDDLIDATHRE